MATKLRIRTVPRKMGWMRVSTAMWKCPEIELNVLSTSVIWPVDVELKPDGTVDRKYIVDDVCVAYLCIHYRL